MATIGVTPANETPLTNGSFAPTFQKPSVCSSVAMPAVKRLAPIRNAVSVALSPQAGPTIIGGATTPAYIAATCWRPLVNILKGGRVSSTGCFRSPSGFCPGFAATAGLLSISASSETGEREAVTEGVRCGAVVREVALVSGAAVRPRLWRVDRRCGGVPARRCKERPRTPGVRRLWIPLGSTSSAGSRPSRPSL